MTFWYLLTQLKLVTECPGQTELPREVPLLDLRHPNMGHPPLDRDWPYLKSRRAQGFTFCNQLLLLSEFGLLNSKWHFRQPQNS